MAGARAFAGEARMGQANRREAVLFIKIEPYQRLGRFLVPRRQPGECEHVWTLDDPIDKGKLMIPSNIADLAAEHPIGPGRIRQNDR